MKFATFATLKLLTTILLIIIAGLMIVDLQQVTDRLIAAELIQDRINVEILRSLERIDGELARLRHTKP